MRPCSGSRHLRVVVAVLLALAVLLASPALDAIPVAAETPTAHAPPVEAPVVDPFREPAGPYGAGNRGLEYATEAGGEVRATAAGEVTFAGQVGGTLHVVVLHDDGLRTSSSFLASIAVARGERVGRGAVLGTSGPSFHLGARAGDRYVDPALLFATGPVEVRLVPAEERRPASSADERRGLVEQLVGAGLLEVAGDAARWLAGGAGDALASGPSAVAATSRHLTAVAGAMVRGAGALTGPVSAASAARARRQVLAASLALRAAVASRRTLAELRADQRRCTPADRSPPTLPPGRRIVVLVAGYGSSGGDAEVLDVDTTALGYAPGDRVQLSYAGGRVPGIGDLTGIPTSPYGPAASMVDLRTSGEVLRRLLDGIGAAHPSVPVDVIAHSQGGLVVREALAGERAAGLPVDHVVTLGSPHLGAPAASLAVGLGLDAPGSPLGAALARASGGGVDPRGPSVAQMAEGAPELRRLARRRLPAGVSFTSVAAAGDLVVPALASTLAGATNVVVDLAGPTAHGRLPGSPEAAREVALALAGAGPTCRSTAALVAAVATSAAATTAEHGLGGLLAPAVLAADGLLALAT